MVVSATVFSAGPGSPPPPSLFKKRPQPSTPYHQPNFQTRVDYAETDAHSCYTYLLPRAHSSWTTSPPVPVPVPLLCITDMVACMAL